MGKEKNRGRGGMFRNNERGRGRGGQETGERRGRAWGSVRVGKLNERSAQRRRMRAVRGRDGAMEEQDGSSALELKVGEGGGGS